jgi:hypothetical protein
MSKRAIEAIQRPGERHIELRSRADRYPRAWEYRRSTEGVYDGYAVVAKDRRCSIGCRPGDYTMAEARQATERRGWKFLQTRPGFVT